MAQRDPWEVYAAAPSAIQGPQKPADPMEVERLRISQDANNRAAISDKRTDVNTTFDNVAKLRGEFANKQSVKDFNTILPQIASAMSIVTGGKATGADDLNLIYTFGKVMDPGSVVREGELALAADTGSFADSLTGAANKIRSGEKLPDNIRRNLVETMRRRGIEMSRAYNRERGTFRSLAERNGFDPYEVIGDHPAQPFQQTEADFTKRTIGNLDGSVGARPKGYREPTLVDPEGNGDIAANIPASEKSAFNPQQSIAIRSFIASNPEATPEQISDFAKGVGVSGTFDATAYKEYVAKGGKEAPGLVEALPKNVEEAAQHTYDNFSNENGTQLGIADAVPFAPQIGAVVDTLGLGGNRPSIWDTGGRSIGEAYEFNRDANDRALDIAQDRNPISYSLGQAGALIAGGAGAMRAVPALGRVGAWASDGALGQQIVRSAPLEAGYGALYGAGRNPNDQLKGALGNAGAAALGGSLGRGTVGAVGSAIAPGVGRTAELYANGVRPTIGQKLGGMANWAEEMAGSVPVVGGVVRGARQQSRDQFERGAFNQALAPIGQQLPEDMALGTAPHAFMQEAFNDAYARARSGMQFVPDADFRTDLAAFSNTIRNGVLDQNEVQQIASIVNSTVGGRLANAGGTLDGDAFKTAVSDIDTIVRQTSRTNPNLSERVAEFGQIVENAARRNSDPAAVELLDAADEGYAQAVRIEQAAAQRSGEIGRFTPTQFDRAVQNSSGGVRSRSYIRGDALMGDYAEAGKTLVDRFPNSGTPERGAVMGALAGGLGYVSPIGGAAALGTMGLYAPGVRNFVSRAIAPRNSQQLNTLGNLIRRNSALGAPVGGAALLPYVPSANP